MSFGLHVPHSKPTGAAGTHPNHPPVSRLINRLFTLQPGELTSLVTRHTGHANKQDRVQIGTLHSLSAILPKDELYLSGKISSHPGARGGASPAGGRISPMAADSSSAAIFGQPSTHQSMQLPDSKSRLHKWPMARQQIYDSAAPTLIPSRRPRHAAAPIDLPGCAPQSTLQPRSAPRYR
jgi:hypothetical protein